MANMGNLLSICEEKFTFTRRREEEENDIADDGFGEAPEPPNYLVCFVREVSKRR